MDTEDTITPAGRALAEDLIAKGWGANAPTPEIFPPAVIDVTPSAPVPQPFDYSDWEPGLANDARAAAVTIRHHMERATASMVEAGECLRSIKDQLPHGEWQAWLAAEFVMSDRMARHLIQVAEAFAGKTEIISVLAPTAAIKLAAAPETARTAIVERLQAGEKMTVAEIVAATRRRPVADQLAVASPVDDGATTAPMAAPMSFADDFRTQAIGPWQEAVIALGAKVHAIADDIKKTTKNCVSRGRPPTKKWAVELYGQIVSVMESVQNLTGKRYCERLYRQRHANGAFVPNGALDDVLDVFDELRRRCHNVKEMRHDPPNADAMMVIRDKLVKAGL